MSQLYPIKGTEALPHQANESGVESLGNNLPLVHLLTDVSGPAHEDPPSSSSWDVPGHRHRSPTGVGGLGVSHT